MNSTKSSNSTDVSSLIVALYIPTEIFLILVVASKSFSKQNLISSSIVQRTSTMSKLPIVVNLWFSARPSLLVINVIYSKSWTFLVGSLDWTAFDIICLSSYFLLPNFEIKSVVSCAFQNWNPEIWSADKKEKGDSKGSIYWGSKVFSDIIVQHVGKF